MLKNLSMRISNESRQIIKATVSEIFGGGARVLLFGSRLDDSRRGGDIDLLVDLPSPEPECQRKSLTCVARLQRRLGDQHIDVLVIDPETPPSPVHLDALRTGVSL